MTDIDHILLKKASGENRLKPEEQGLYLGTFRERVILAVRVADASQQETADRIGQSLQVWADDYGPVSFKISTKLPQDSQMAYMKLAQESGLAFTLVQETATSPYGLVLHSDRALNLEEISPAGYWQTNEATETTKEASPKLPFWRKWLG